MSDHSIVCATFENNEKGKRGKGLWKFNNALLRDTCFVKDMNLYIKNEAENLNYLEDKGLKWEIIKMKIRSFSIQYSAKISKEKKEFKNSLYKRLNEIQPYIDNENDQSALLKEEYFNLKSELEGIEKHETMGAIIRAKAKWVEDGEKNTKYFMNLEKKNYTNKVISQLNINGDIITDSNAILKAQYNFYNTLYTDKIDTSDCNYNLSIESFTKTPDLPKLSTEQSQQLDQVFTEKEIHNSLKQLKNNKTPGSDGISVEFLKFFWVYIKDPLLDSINYAFHKKELSTEQKRGIISLIPKKDKCRFFLKNWRPITLLNSDYKIITKLLAIRLQEVLPSIVCEDQTGYIKGRFIGQNIRIMEDVVYFTEMNDLPGIILSIDFEKAFDSISWDFIDKSLEAFNFGVNFRMWIKILYKNIQSAVINNGNITEWFSPTRGIRQGCPLSAYLFIIAAETLAHKIRTDKKIEGIKIANFEIKISQLADDTNCFLKDHKSLKQTLYIFNLFSISSGLKINISKTKAKYIGSLKDSDYFPHGLSWIREPIQSLGIFFTSSESENYLLNYKPRIEKLQNMLLVWAQRGLSLKGKITIINNLALSPLIYVAAVIDTPECVIREVDNIITNFLWKGKTSKIAKNVIIQNIENGGLKFPDFGSKVKALKITWVKRLTLHAFANWKLFPKFIYDTDDLEFFFCCKQQYDQNVKIPKFYKTIHNEWFKLHSVEPTSGKLIKNEVLWNNKFITVNKKPMLPGEWYRSGIVYVHDLLDQNGCFLNYTQIKEKYGVKCSFLDILQVRYSLPSKWRQILKDQEFKENPNKIIKGCFLVVSNLITSIEKLYCKDFYWMLVSEKKAIPTCINKWIEYYPNLTKLDGSAWSDIFKMSFTSTRETKLQSFQYQLIHRITPTNKWLYDKHLRDDPLCKFCTLTDNIPHFFIWCENASKFWRSFFRWWIRTTEINISDDDIFDECILFGYPGEDNMITVLNYCVILAKYYIYIKKLKDTNNLDLYEFLVMLKGKLLLEKTICIENDRVLDFEKWKIVYDNL